MAGGKSEFLELQVLDWVMSQSNSWTPPATVYVALSTAVWDDTLTGSALSEPSGGAYARASVTNNLTNWPAAASPGSGLSAVKSNGTTISFPTPTADWGTIKSMAVCDAATAGNVMFGGDLSSEKVILSADATAFSPGTLVWSED